MIFEEKITSSKTSFQMALIYWRWTHILEWSYTRQHDKTMIIEMGGVVDIMVVDAYSRVDVCMPMFMGEASN
jgi:hypothetical protein